MIVELTPLQRKILNALSDGKRHEVSALMELMKPSGRNALSAQICLIRKSLHVRGEDILCVYRDRRKYYQHVRLLHSPYDGRT